MLVLKTRHKNGILQFGGDPDVWADAQPPTWGHTRITWSMSIWKNLPFNFEFTYDIVSPVNNPATTVLLTAEGALQLDEDHREFILTEDANRDPQVVVDTDTSREIED